MQHDRPQFQTSACRSNETLGVMRLAPAEPKRKRPIRVMLGWISDDFKCFALV
jgi:hypothetical protein